VSCYITVEADAGKMLPLTFIKHISFERSSNRDIRLRMFHNKVLRIKLQKRDRTQQDNDDYVIGWFKICSISQLLSRGNQELG
jgi:hypothetical protein